MSVPYACLSVWALDLIPPNEVGWGVGVDGVGGRDY